MSYFKHIWKVNRGFTIFSMLFISLFQLMLLYLVTTFDTQAMLVSVLRQMPEKFRIFLNDSFFSMLSLDGAAAFGFNHPIVLTILAIVAISIPVRHISREMENGTLEMILALPFKRKTLIRKLWLSGVFILSIIIIASLMGSLIAVLIFHEISLQITVNLFLISMNNLLIFTLIMTYTMFIATWSKGGGFSGNLVAGITLFFYLLFFVGQIWDFLKPTLWFNIFNYYQPQKVMTGNGILWVDFLVLSGLTFIFYLLSLKRFNVRDIP